jgi:hypothetical protein
MTPRMVLAVTCVAVAALGRITTIPTRLTRLAYPTYLT